MTYIFYLILLIKKKKKNVMAKNIVPKDWFIINSVYIEYLHSTYNTT